MRFVQWLGQIGFDALISYRAFSIYFLFRGGQHHNGMGKFCADAPMARPLIPGRSAARPHSLCDRRFDQLRDEFFVIDHRRIRGGREDNGVVFLRRVI
jgi:hypothetical protein